MTAVAGGVVRGFDVGAAEAAIARAEEAREPSWSLARRRAAADVMRTLSFPGPAHELWRRTDFRSLEAVIERLDPFAAGPVVRRAAELPATLAARLGGGSEPAAIVAQLDSRGVFEQADAGLSRQGVIACGLERAASEHGARLEPVYGTLIHDDYDWYTAFGGAVRGGGAFVFVPDGVEAAHPIRLFHWIGRPGVLASPRTVVVLGRGARATVIEEELSETAEGASFHLGGTEVFLGEDARLVYASHQDWGRNVYHYSNQRARLGRGAELQWVQTLLGGRMTKTNSFFDLAGPGAQAFVHGFVFGDGRQHFHVHTLQKHLLDHTTSDLLVKVCLKDRARSVYQGLIQVAEGAQRTDAYQANRNLLLSDTARADSIPGLEILANDVRCTHGATIGTVDAEQMYYLMSRGLSRTQAQRLIVEGFFAPVLDRIPLEGVREQLRQVIQRKIG